MATPVRILYVEDNPIDRRLTRYTLEQEHDGFVIADAATLQEFQERMAESTYDLVLTDFHFSGFDGLRILDLVKAKNPRMPVVFVTCTGSEEIAVETMKRGADEYVLKTSKHIQRLPAVIRAVLEKYRLQEEREYAQEMLARVSEKHKRLATAFQQTTEGMVITDTDWIVDYVNPACERITGYGGEELTGQSIWPFLFAENIKVSLEIIKDALSRGEIWRGHVISGKKDGSPLESEVSVSPVRNDMGIIVNYVMIVQDVTERVKLEKQFRQAQKLEAIGVLAGGIAHDFNNILSAITGFTELALSEVEEGTDAWEDLQEVLKGARRAKDLVSQILTFSRQTEQEWKPIRIGLVVKEALKLLRASLPSTIEIVENIASKGTVLADATQIHQVLMNLCTNASHAMREKGGVLEVRMVEMALDPDSARTYPALHPGPYLKLSVSDTGEGIGPEIMERIFDPFFTTKGPGEGTGLGLAVVHGIVKAHGGAVKIYSEPEVGTTVNILLPKIETQIEKEASVVEPLARGNERVLFVDDEPALARIGKRILERLGYRVAIRTSGIDALEAFRAQSPEARFDLVITDMTMPHMTGLELSLELLRIRPDIPIILCTGFSERITPERAKAYGIRGFLMKPLTAADLAATARRVLDK